MYGCMYACREEARWGAVAARALPTWILPSRHPIAAPLLIGSCPVFYQSFGASGAEGGGGSTGVPDAHRHTHTPCLVTLFFASFMVTMGSLKTHGYVAVYVCVYRERGRLIDCYAAFFVKRCGDTSRRTLRPLLRMHYAFDFLQPCVGRTTSRTSPAPPSTTPAGASAVTWSAARRTTAAMTSRPASNAPSPVAVVSGRPRRADTASRDLTALLAALASASALSTTSS